MLIEFELNPTESNGRAWWDCDYGVFDGRDFRWKASGIDKNGEPYKEEFVRAFLESGEAMHITLNTPRGVETVIIRKD